MADFKQALEAHEISVDCPKCGQKLQKTLGWFKSHPNPTCSCGVVFDADKLRAGMADAEKAFSDAMQKLSKSLNVTLKF